MVNKVVINDTTLKQLQTKTLLSLRRLSAHAYCDEVPGGGTSMDDERRRTDMADAKDDELTILKGSKILVVIEEALVDVIVVSYKSGAKIFQGALLDITKKDSPFGIVPKPSEDPLWKASATLPKANEIENDRFHSLSQRYTYYQQGFSPCVPEPPPRAKKSVPRHRDQNVRMRRLRPRQVLCSHCRTLCNESISVQSGNISSSTIPTSTRNKLNDNVDINLNNNSDTANRNVNNSDMGPGNAPSQCNTSEPKVAEEATGTHNKQCDPVEASCDGDSGDNSTVSSVELSNRMVLRKRKIPSGLNDYLDSAKQQRKTEVVDTGTNDTSKSQISCPVIKISYADPEGKDTVLKIPARLATTSDDESVWFDDVADKEASAKAARKALKKAKKEGHRKSWCQMVDNGNILEKDKHHHHHHHHKHKLKRKRKHKEFLDKEDYDSENVYSDKFRPELNFMDDDDKPGWSLCSTDNGEDHINEKEFYNNVRNKCLKQKLSISLKRLSAKAYMRCSPKYFNEDTILSSSSESECGDVPDFPMHEPLRDMEKVKPLMMRIGSQNVKKCLLDNGREMSVGDIVWGKIQGFPWWPGKILALTVSQRDNGTTLNHQAHVAWFGSSTSSYMSCNQLAPFLDDFKLRHNKKKRGPYKEAIRQATIEAQPDLPNDLICNEAIS